MLLETLFLLFHLFCNVHFELIWLIEFQNKTKIEIIGFFAFSICLRFMNYRFVAYRLVRCWFRLLTRPWLDTDIHNKHFICLQDVFKTSLRHVLKTSSRRFARCFQDFFNTYLLDVFKTYLQDISKTSCKTKNYYAEDVLKTSS